MIAFIAGMFGTGFCTPIAQWLGVGAMNRHILMGRDTDMLGDVGERLADVRKTMIASFETDDANVRAILKPPRRVCRI